MESLGGAVGNLESFNNGGEAGVIHGGMFFTINEKYLRSIIWGLDIPEDLGRGLTSWASGVTKWQFYEHIQW